MHLEHYSFPVFKGLQKPLEFMGIRGRFLMIAAICIGASFLGCCICLAAFSQIVALIYLAISITASLLFIYIRQKEGLHSKKKCNSIIIYHHLFKQ